MYSDLQKICKNRFKKLWQQTLCTNSKSTELVSAVAVGTIIGFILDKTFGTKPWLILIFFFIGVTAGIINVFRSAKNMQK